MAERWEWVEIIEPRTKDHMYANLTTGECVWDPPPGVKIKKTDDNQWWELFDPNTHRFYYYNATSQQTVWHRPSNCDIIPLAKLQTLKQNTEVRDDEERFPPPKREISTQTPLPTPKREHHVRTGSLKGTSTQPHTSPHPSRKQRFSRQDSNSSHSSSSHHDSFKEHRLSSEQIRRRGSQSSSQSTPVGFSSSPSFQAGIVRRESVDMSNRGVTDSPRLQRAHSSVQRSESSHSGGLPTRSGSYRYVDVRIRDESPVYARDDSYLYQGHYLRGYRHGSGSDKDYTYSSRSETYTPPILGQDIYSGPVSLHSQDSSTYLDQHDRGTYSPVSQTASDRQEQVYSPVLHMSKPEHADHGQYSPSLTGSHSSREDQQSTGLYSPVLVGAPRDECIAFSQDIVGAQTGNVSPALHKPKLRFPRTNPTYVGVNRRDGQTSYKKINVDQQGLELGASSDGQSQYNSSSMQTSQIHPDYFDAGYYRHERSDSDASHTSSRVYRHERTDSQASHSPLRNRELSDSQSSQGSTRNMSDVQSSEGSLRNMQDSAVSFQDSISSRGSCRSTGIERETTHERSSSQHSTRSVKVSDNDGEPEYENLPPSTPTKTVEFSLNNIEQNNLRNVLRERNSNINSDEFREDIEIADSFNIDDLNVDLNGRSEEEDPMMLLMQSSGFSEDQGYDDDAENANMFAIPNSPYRSTGAIKPSHLSIETQHASLKRKKHEKMEAPSVSPNLEKSTSLQAELAMQRPLSMVVASQSEANMSISPSAGSLCRQNRAGTCPPIGSAKNLSIKQKLPSDSDIENYAQQHLNKHKKGLFGKNVPLTNMLKWSKDLIQKPMLRTNDKNVKKEACEVFKLIQMYMGDRKTKQSQSSIALEITIKGWSMGADLRDEIFIQICRQTTENKKEDSLQRGWELMAVLLNFFPPTHKFYSYLEGYISRYLDPQYDLENFNYAQWCLDSGIVYGQHEDEHNVPIHHFAEHCQRRLEKTMQSGAKRGIRKPTLEEIEQAKKSIYCPSMFGSTLQDVMKMQSDHFGGRRLPWIQTTLSEAVLRLNGAQTEGIFRVPGDIDEVNALKIHCDQWKVPADCPDPHVPASLLKLWYRELEEPLIPAQFYPDCIEHYTDPDAAIDVVNRLPDINRIVLSYLIRFLQVFASPQNSNVTKMDVNNLAMVMAPNCLRCESEDPRVIFENTRKEMGFLRTLIQSLDTNLIEGVE